MADVNISTSDTLGIFTGKTLKLITGNLSRITVENDLKLIKSDASTAVVPVTNDTISVLKNDTTLDTISLIPDLTVIAMKAGLLVVDSLSTVVLENTSIIVFVTVSDDMGLVVTDTTNKPFLIGISEIWDYIKEEDTWDFTKEKDTWIFKKR